MKLRLDFLFIGLVAAFTLLSGCDRPAPESARVALQLPVYESDGTLSTSPSGGGLAAQSAASSAVLPGISACSICLKEIIVNVDGNDFKTISLIQKHEDFEQEGTQLSAEIVLEVPAGPQRKIQILALYRNPGADGGVRVQYGQVSVDLASAEPPPIYMTLASVGQFKGGSVTGRYLTGTASGPTGKVNIEFRHPVMGSAIEITGGEILNGWFSFFASGSADFPLTYRLAETGQVLFTEATTESLRRDVPYIAHVRRPAAYRQTDGGYEVVPGENLVYGFFGPGVNPASQKVCVYATATDLTNMFKDSAGAQELNYSYGGSADLTGTVYASGGKGHNSAACASNDISNAKNFGADLFAVQADQFDGKGNDHARALEGAFSYSAKYDAGLLRSVVKRFHVGIGTEGLAYKMAVLPGLFTSFGGNMFSGVRLFRKADGAADSDRRNSCAPAGLTARGFSEVPPGDFLAVPAVTASGDFTFRLGQLQTGDEAYIACPLDLAGQVAGVGGIYLGSLGETIPPVAVVSPANDIFNLAYAYVETHTYTITNDGPVPITITAVPVVLGSGSGLSNSDFSVAPNNCYANRVLIMGDTCSFDVTFTANNVGNFGGNIIVQYFNGRTTAAGIVGLTANSSP